MIAAALVYSQFPYVALLHKHSYLRIEKALSQYNYSGGGGIIMSEGHGWHRGENHDADTICYS